MTLLSREPTSALSDTLDALRCCLRKTHPLVVEREWDGYFAYGAPQVFAYLWPQPTHVTIGLLEGARLRPPSRRLLGHGPALRTILVRDALEIDAELQSLLERAAGMAVRDGLRSE